MWSQRYSGGKTQLLFCTPVICSRPWISQKNRLKIGRPASWAKSGPLSLRIENSIVIPYPVWCDMAKNSQIIGRSIWGKKLGADQKWFDQLGMPDLGRPWAKSYYCCWTVFNLSTLFVSLRSDRYLYFFLPTYQTCLMWGQCHAKVVKRNSIQLSSI